MTPLTKETIEAAGKSAESAGQRTVAPAPNPERMRSEAVSLEIPIKVHGSRITEVVMGVTPHTEPFEEQSTTMIVFAQGGVLKLSTPVTSGQMMVLTNLKTRQDVICRVLKVRNNPNLQAYVEIEFTHPQPGYWGVFFPSDDSESAARPASLSQPLNSESPINPEINGEASRPFAGPSGMPSVAPARPPAAAVPSDPPAKSPTPGSYVAPQPRLGSAFIGIGSQEEVQVAASATLPKNKNVRSIESVKENRAVNVSKNISAAELEGVSPVSSAPAFSRASVSDVRAQSKIELQPPAEIPAASTTRTFGEFGASATSISSREMFGSTLGVSSAGNSTGETQPRRNWILVAACAAVALVAAGAGAMYFHAASSGKTAAKSVAAPSAPEVETTQNPVQSDAADQTPYSIPASHTDSATNDPRSADKPTPATGSKTIVTDHVETAPPVQVVTSVNPKVIAGATSARPLTAQRGGANAVDAPTLSAEVTSPGAGGTLTGMVGSSNALPPPPVAPARVGGTVTAPKLVTSTPPIYPPAAKQAKVDGDVVVHAIIDSEGNVAKATVISGPPLLRDAALSAVKHWKYSPSLLNGDPVASDTTVTLKFRN